METVLPWIAALLIIAAASMTAANLGARITGYGFIVFTLGSLAWLATGLVQNDMSIVWQNVILTALNLFGVWRWLGREARFEEGGQQARRDSAESDGETLFPASLLTTAKVEGGDGDAIGQAVDALIGCRSGVVQAIIVSEGGIGGVGETLRRVPWTRVDPSRDGLTARFGKSEFSGMIKVERDDWLKR